MQDTLQKLAELKMKLVTATEFYKVIDYFHDNFGENESLALMSVPKQNEFLQQSLVICVRSALKQQIVAVNQMMMLYVEQAQFYHGWGWFNYLIANFFYFEDIDAGLMALVVKPNSGETMLARFSTHLIDQTKKPSTN